MSEETVVSDNELRAETRQAGRFSRALNFVLENLAMVLMAILTMLVFANAFSRYAFSAPLPWTEEAVTYLLVWLAAVGIIIAGLRQTLICCDIITDRLRPGRQRILGTACALLGSATMFYCAWLTWQYMQIFGADLSPVLRVPKGVLMMALLVALLGLAVTLLVPLFKKR
ncbi:MAG: TRAP transporter small permease [Pseudaminobacter sp.]